MDLAAALDESELEEEEYSELLIEGWGTRLRRRWRGGAFRWVKSGPWGTAWPISRCPLRTLTATAPIPAWSSRRYPRSYRGNYFLAPDLGYSSPLQADEVRGDGLSADQCGLSGGGYPKGVWGSYQGWSIRSPGRLLLAQQVSSRSVEWEETENVDRGMLGLTIKHIYFAGEKRKFSAR